MGACVAGMRPACQRHSALAWHQRDVDMQDRSGAADAFGDAPAVTEDAAPVDAVSLRQHRRACVGMCMALQLKFFLLAAYHIKRSALQDYDRRDTKCAALRFSSAGNYHAARCFRRVELSAQLADHKASRLPARHHLLCIHAQSSSEDRIDPTHA